MSKGAKILLAVATTFVVRMIGSGMLLAASVARAGSVRVKIHEPGPSGPHVNVRNPAAVVSLGMSLMPLVLDDDLSAEIRADLGEYRPAVAAGAPRARGRAGRRAGGRPRWLRERAHHQGGPLAGGPRGKPGRNLRDLLPAHLLGRIAREIA